MTTTTLYSKLSGFGGMYKRTMARNISAMVYLTVLGFVFFPLQFILRVYSVSFSAELATANIINSIGDAYFGILTTGHTGVSLTVFSFMMCIAPLVIGLSHFRFMHSKKAVDVYHSLPIRRDTLIYSNVLAAFTTVMVPAAINYLIILSAGTFRGIGTAFQLNHLSVLSDFIYWAAIAFVIIAITAFVAVQVGAAFENFIFTCEILFAPIACVFLTLGLCDTYLRGFSMGDVNPEILMYLTPFSTVIWRYTWSAFGTYDNSAEVISAMARNHIALFVWVLLAVIMLVGAVFLYRKRRSEIAQQSTSRSVLAQIGKFLAIYVGGNLFGLLFGGLGLGAGSAGSTSFVVWSIVGAALIYIIAEVILNRGFKGIAKGMWSGLVSVGLVAVCAIIITTGGAGYESYLPATDQIASIEIDYRGRYSLLDEYDHTTAEKYQTRNESGNTINEEYYYKTKGNVVITQPDAIAALRDFHKSVVEITDTEKELYDPYSMDYGYAGNSEISAQITYTLKNGQRVKRNYHQREISMEDAQLLLTLENTTQFKELTHPVFRTKGSQYSKALLSDQYGLENTSITGEANMQKLLDAIAKDMLAEDLYRLQNGQADIIGYMNFQYKVNPRMVTLQEDTFASNYVYLTSDYTNTLQVLKELGLEGYVSTTPTELSRIAIENYGYRYTSYNCVLSLTNIDSLFYAIEQNAALMGEGTEEQLEDFEGAQFEAKDVDFLFVSTSTAEISQLLSKARTVHPRDEKMLAISVWNQADIVSPAMVYIALEDIPANILKQFPDYFFEDNHYQWSDQQTTTTAMAASSPLQARP